MTTNRWSTRLAGPDLYIIEREHDGDMLVVGSIVRLLVNTWCAEIMWTGAGGDIQGEFTDYPQALAFVQGVEQAMMRMPTS